MKKKILKIAILILIIIFLMPYTIKVQAADRSLITLYFEGFYRPRDDDRTDQTYNNDVLKFLDNCTDEELRKIATHDQYYNTDQYKEDYVAEKEIHNKYEDGYEKQLANAMNSAFLNYVSQAHTVLVERQGGAPVGGGSEEEAKKISEQIKQIYSEIQNNLEGASEEQLQTINKLMKDLYAQDSGVKDYYEAKEISDIRINVNKEIKRRNPNAETSSENIIQSGVQIEDELNKPLQEREGNKPKEDIFASYNPDEKTSPDEIINDGADFLETGKENQGFVFINGDKVENASSMLFNVLFSVGIGISLLIGLYLGIKFMISSVEDKANIKESLLPYFAGVIIMLASFSIWKLILVLLQAIDKI